MKIEKCHRMTKCGLCRKQMEPKDWRIATREGYSEKDSYYHLTCYMKWAEKKKKHFSQIIHTIKSHKHILKKEKEKLILRAI